MAGDFPWFICMILLLVFFVIQMVNLNLHRFWIPKNTIKRIMHMNYGAFFGIQMENLNGLDQELGSHRSAQSQIYKLGHFYRFNQDQWKLKVIQDLLFVKTSWMVWAHWMKIIKVFDRPCKNAITNVVSLLMLFEERFDSIFHSYLGVKNPV